MVFRKDEPVHRQPLVDPTTRRATVPRIYMEYTPEARDALDPLFGNNDDPSTLHGRMRHATADALGYDFTETELVWKTHKTSDENVAPVTFICTTARDDAVNASKWQIAVCSGIAKAFREVVDGDTILTDFQVETGFRTLGLHGNMYRVSYEVAADGTTVISHTWQARGDGWGEIEVELNGVEPGA